MADLISRDDMDRVVRARTEEYIRDVSVATGCAVKIIIESEKEKMTIENIHYPSSAECQEDLPYEAETLVPSLEGPINVKLRGTIGFDFSGALS